MYKEKEKLLDGAIDNLIKNKKEIIEMLINYKKPTIKYFNKEANATIEILFKLLDKTNCEFIFK